MLYTVYAKTLDRIPDLQAWSWAETASRPARPGCMIS